MTKAEQKHLLLRLGFVQGHTYEVASDGTVRDVTEHEHPALVASGQLAGQRLPAGELETRRP